MPRIYPQQEWKPNPAFDKSKLFKLTTISKSYELLLLTLAVVFGGGMALSYMTYTLFKEDVRVNKHKKIAPYEEYAEEHRAHFIVPPNIHHAKLPADVVELKKALGPYEVK